MARRPEETERDRWLAEVGALPGVLVYRIEPVRGAHGQRSAPVGHADCIFAADGRVVAVEWKSAAGRLSPEQERWAAAWRAAGCAYLVARDAGRCCRDLAALVPAMAGTLGKCADLLDEKKCRLLQKSS